MIADLRNIARALDGEIVAGQVSAPGPGHSRRDRSMTVRLSATAPHGFLAFSHAGDPWETCRDYVRERLGLSRDAWRNKSIEPTPRPKIAAPAASSQDDGKRTAAAMRLWRAGVDPRGTLVETYLNSRDLTLDVDIAGEVIRWHSGIGAMIALFRDIRTKTARR